jgi:hypothetical protein
MLIAFPLCWREDLIEERAQGVDDLREGYRFRTFLVPAILRAFQVAGSSRRIW